MDLLQIRGAAGGDEGAAAHRRCSLPRKKMGFARRWTHAGSTFRLDSEDATENFRCQWGRIQHILTKLLTSSDHWIGRSPETARWQPWSAAWEDEGAPDFGAPAMHRTMVIMRQFGASIVH
ncbi:hypothetical protein ACLOJK_041017 [Asimina triloba]